VSTSRPNHAFDLIVTRKETAADGVVLLTLRDPKSSELPAWHPGAHIDLILRGDLVRQYSLCGDPNDANLYQVAVLREAHGRGGSAYVHDQLTQGDEVRVGGPRNNFRLEAAKRYLFIAGGIGITPILPMVKAIASGGADWRLVYGGRTKDSMAFRAELNAMFGQLVEIRPEDETGLLDVRGVLCALAGTDEAVVYCCGPDGLVSAVAEHCAALGLSFRVERFKTPAAPDVHVTGRFQVELARSGMTLAVPEDLTIVEVLEDAGVAVQFLCEEGVCGTCTTRVLDGHPDHRDHVLTTEQRAAGYMALCVSRSRSPRIVLDL
jgi:ferredoxin-NADP reductase